MNDCTTGHQLRDRLHFIGGALEGLPQFGRRLNRAIDRIENDIRWTRSLVKLAALLDADKQRGHCALASDINERLDAFESGYRRVALGYRTARDEIESAMVPLMSKRVCDRVISDTLKNYFY